MNYEDYMQNVLGYSGAGCGCGYNNLYNTYDLYEQDNNYPYSFSNMNVTNRISQDNLDVFYPEIYKLLYPMVCKSCNMNKNREMTKELLEEMTEDLYRNFDSTSDNTPQSNTRAPLKNGDVRNPNVKEPEVVQENRQINFLLRDLIQILLLKEFGRPCTVRPPFNPGYPPPMPPMPPPRPGGRPPIRPRPF